MALLVKGGGIFLHIPKTGGNWVRRVLKESGLAAGSIGTKHADIGRLFSPAAKSTGNLLKYYVRRGFGLYPRGKHFLFCFVRDPLAWYESWFKYMSQPSRNWCHFGDENDTASWHPNAMLNGVGAPEFNQFVRNVVQKRPGYVTELFGWYTTPQVDFVGKQENLREDLIQVLKLLGLNFDEEFIRSYRKVGVSQPPCNQIEWDPELKKEVCRLEYAGLMRYGYLPENLE